MEANINSKAKLSEDNTDEVQHWRYTAETWRGELYLGKLKVKTNESVTSVMSNLQQELRRLKSGSDFGFLDRRLPFWTTVVDEGVLSLVR
jgi:hypothetical protein